VGVRRRGGGRQRPALAPPLEVYAGQIFPSSPAAARLLLKHLVRRRHEVRPLEEVQPRALREAEARPAVAALMRSRRMTPMTATTPVMCDAGVCLLTTSFYF
jgi:hypothetical protein